MLSRQQTTKALIRLCGSDNNGADQTAQIRHVYSHDLAQVNLYYRELFQRIEPNEPRHDKTNKVTVRPAKTQISLGILGFVMSRLEL